jgi:hypothetical protein
MAARDIRPSIKALALVGARTAVAGADDALGPFQWRISDSASSGGTFNAADSVASLIHYVKFRQGFVDGLLY